MLSRPVMREGEKKWPSSPLQDSRKENDRCPVFFPPRNEKRGGGGVLRSLISPDAREKGERKKGPLLRMKRSRSTGRLGAGREGEGLFRPVIAGEERKAHHFSMARKKKEGGRKGQGFKLDRIGKRDRNSTSPKSGEGRKVSTFAYPEFAGGGEGSGVSGCPTSSGREEQGKEKWHVCLSFPAGSGKVDPQHFHGWRVATFGKPRRSTRKLWMLKLLSR